MGAPLLSWDQGTAYDLFISLNVLHNPGNYGVRPAWAAGMRSRLPGAERETLEKLFDLLGMATPLGWVYHLPQPKNGQTVLAELERLPARTRLFHILFEHHREKESDRAFYRSIVERGAYSKQDVDTVYEMYRKHDKKGITREKAAHQLDIWADAEAFGESYLSAIRAYYDVFFAEEEARIRPYLDEALAKAQGLAAELSITELLEQLSQGVRFEEPPEAGRIVLAPSFWGSPYLHYVEVEPDIMLVAFGARPDDASVVPGEVVPDALLNALKAMGDPTRLRILRYLTDESLTPTQLARRLRLRAPTVIHHLSMLRVAGLVQVTVSKKEKIYALRKDGVEAVCRSLKGFLETGECQGELEAHIVGGE
ncbi:MAG: hypothetical protein Kow00124_16800 [Anaerolineae bacterium]